MQLDFLNAFVPVRKVLVPIQRDGLGVAIQRAGFEALIDLERTIPRRLLRLPAQAFDLVEVDAIRPVVGTPYQSILTSRGRTSPTSSASGPS